MSINLSDPSVDERARFGQAELPERSRLLVPGGLHAEDLPATRSSFQRRSTVINKATRVHAWLRELCAVELARGAGFLCIPVFLGSGAVLYYALPEEPPALVLGATGACLAILTWLARQRSLMFFLLAALLVVVLGVASAKLETWRASTPMLGSDIATRVTGRVIRIEHQAAGRVRLTLDVLKTERPELRHAPKRVRLTARKVPESLRSGDVVQGFARLLQASGPVRPGSYDFAFANYFNGLGATGFFLSEVQPSETERALSIPERLLGMLETMREALAARIRAHVSGPEGEIAVALITGYRAGIPEEMNEALRRSGLAHVLSISGLHMALVAGTVMLMIRSGGALFPVFASSFPVKKLASVAALLFCTLYLAISGADVAAQRSYLMLAVMLAATLIDRAAISMRNVAIAATAMLAISPHEVVGPSFQMSFAATAALVAGYAAWSDWRSKRLATHAIPSRHIWVRLLGYLVAAVSGLALTSVIAGTATAIYGIWHFQRATLFSLPSNLLAMPAISAIVMPSAVCAILALPFGLEGYFLQAMQWGIGIMVDIATWFSDRTPVDAVGFMPVSAILWFTAGLLVLVISTTRLRLMALPLVALGLASVTGRTFPDVMISEDARLVAVRDENGTLMVNRSRPAAFAMDDWKRALMAEVVMPPSKDADPSEPQRFSCENNLCIGRHGTGVTIVHAQTARSAASFCDQMSVIVVEEATPELPCGSNPEATVITGRELARRGSAAVFLRGEGGRPQVVHAIAEPWRPWHEHRAFSRAARGLAQGGER